MPRALAILSAVVTLASPAYAVPQVPDAGLRGQAVFRALGVPMYNARLYTPNAGALDWRGSFALELTYLRDIRGMFLIRSTRSEMTRLGFDAPDRDILAGCFQDVAAGDRYLAVPLSADALGFWRNGAPACTLEHPNIARGFMAIFLGDNTRSPAFTRALRAE